MRTVGLVAAAVVVGLAGAGTTAVAVAATDWRPVAETGAPGRLVLDTGPSALALPEPGSGQDALWPIRTRVEVAGPVELDLELRKDGAIVRAPAGLEVAVSSCDEEWTVTDGTPRCRGGSGSLLLTATPADDWSAASPVVRIPDPDGDGSAFVLVRLSLGADDGSLSGLGGRVGLGVTARSVDADPAEPAGRGPADPGSSAVGIGSRVLAYTGGGFAGPVLVAVALVLAGAAIRLRRTDRGGPDHPTDRTDVPS